MSHVRFGKEGKGSKESQHHVEAAGCWKRLLDQNQKDHEKAEKLMAVGN